MAAKAMEDTCPTHVQMEGNEEGDMELMFGLDQATMIDEQQKSCACLENADQLNFGSSLKDLQSQKILENYQYSRTMLNAHSVLRNLDD